MCVWRIEIFVQKITRWRKTAILAISQKGRVLIWFQSRSCFVKEKFRASKAAPLPACFSAICLQAVSNAMPAHLQFSLPMIVCPLQPLWWHGQPQKNNDRKLIPPVLCYLKWSATLRRTSEPTRTLNALRCSAQLWPAQLTRLYSQIKVSPALVSDCKR